VQCGVGIIVSWKIVVAFMVDTMFVFCFVVIVGEIANFAAYAFAPAILVTPLGALSIIIRCEQTRKFRITNVFSRLGTLLH